MPGGVRRAACPLPPGDRARCRRGSPAPARPGPPRPPPPAPIAAGSRRRSWPAGWPWPAPRGASGALPTSAWCPGRPSGSATRQWLPRRAPRRDRLPRTSRALALTPSRRAAPDQCQRRLGPRAADLQRRRPARFGQRAVRQERPAPGGFGIGDTAADDLCGQIRAPGGREDRAVRSDGPAPHRLWRPAPRTGCSCGFRWRTTHARPRCSRTGRRCPCAADAR